MNTKFVIASIQRSGTTRLKDLLASHPEISSNQEILKNINLSVQEGEKLIKSHDSSEKIFGFKLMLNQIDGNKWITDFLNRNSYKVILMHRRPLIDVYLSHEIAKRDNRWSINNEVDVEPITLNPYETVKQIKLLQMYQSRLEELLEPFPKYQLFYKDVNSKKKHQEIMDFLGVRRPVTLLSNQKKVLPKNRWHYVKNREEILITLTNAGLNDETSDMT